MHDLAIQPRLYLNTAYFDMSDEDADLPITTDDRGSLSPPIDNDDQVSVSALQAPSTLTRHQADDRARGRYQASVHTEDDDEANKPAVSIEDASTRSERSHGRSTGTGERVICLDTTVIPTMECDRPQTHSQPDSTRSLSLAEKFRATPSLNPGTRLGSPAVQEDSTHRRRRRRPQPTIALSRNMLMYVLLSIDLCAKAITDFVKASLKASLTAIGTRVSQEHRGDGDTSEDASTVTAPSELTENRT